MYESYSIYKTRELVLPNTIKFNSINVISYTCDWQWQADLADVVDEMKILHYANKYT